MHKTPKEHHFVPQCYINEFAFKKELFCLDIVLVRKGLNFHVRKTTPKKVCKHDYLYQIKDEDFIFLNDKEIKNPLFLELMAFKKFEDKYVKVKDKLLKKKKLLLKEATVLANFILDLKIRNPKFLEKIQGIIDEFTPNSINKIVTELQTDFPQIKEQFKLYITEFLEKKLIKNTLNSENFARQMGIAFLVNRSDKKSSIRNEFIDRLLKLKWFVYVILSEDEFITNDNPGFSLDSNVSFYNTLFEGDFQFHLPLDSKNCLVFNGNVLDNDIIKDDFIKEIDFRIADSNFVNQVNVGQIIYSIQFLYSKSKSTLEAFLPKLIKYQNQNDYP